MTSLALSPKPTPTAAAAKPLRVMVVDDSLVLRGAISRMINEARGVAEVVASASNGALAVERVKQGDIDVIVLDIEMPVMDGITALPKILAIDPSVVVIMASTLTTRNADISLKAITAGAKDYVPKPTSVAQGNGAEDFKRELLEKIRVLGARYRRVAGLGAAGVPAKAALVATRALNPGKPSVLAIGSSTGGPAALQLLFKSLRAPLKVPVLVTQHMPPTFTALLAENLSRETGHVAAEAKHGETLTAGRVYVAPGDFHMRVMRVGTTVTVRLDQQAKENFCRPAVDPMLRSLVEAYPRQVLTAVLTGMGQDGLLGAEAVVKSGGNVLAQDEASSVVWGMPGVIARAGLATGVMPVPQLAARINEMLER